MLSSLTHSDLTGRVIAAAIKVHRTLGSGFLESVYENALCKELTLRGIQHVRQREIAVIYEGSPVGVHRLDLLVDEMLILELKACRAIERAHFAVVRSYLTASRLSLALLMNFGEVTLTVKRVAPETGGARKA